MKNKKSMSYGAKKKMATKSTESMRSAAAKAMKKTPTKRRK